MSGYCRAGRLPQTGFQSSQLDHCDEPLQGAYVKTWQLGMPKYSRESSFDRHLSFDMRSELNTATLPRDSQNGPLCEFFCSLLGYDPGWSPPLHILRSPAPRTPFHPHSHHRGRDHRHGWRRRLPHPPRPRTCRLGRAPLSTLPSPRCQWFGYRQRSPPFRGGGWARAEWLPDAKSLASSLSLSIPTRRHALQKSHDSPIALLKDRFGPLPPLLNSLFSCSPALWLITPAPVLSPPLVPALPRPPGAFLRRVPSSSPY